MTRLSRIVTALAITLVICPVVVMAQGTTSLRGTVTDPSGAVVPNASIEIQNIATQSATTVKSDQSGLYLFPQVAPGVYRLTATAEGFAQIGVPRLDLLVSQPMTQDIQFTELGPVNIVVTVEANATTINTVDASMGNAVGTNTILQLPFEARNVPDLLSLQPGVAYIRDTPEDFTDDTRNGAVNGGKSDQANITLDGVDVNDQQNGFAFQSVLRVTLDSVQEFRTTTLNAGADEGRSSGAQVQMITKSGSNNWHGSLYEYHRNTATSANSFFNNAVPASDDNPSGGIPREKLIRNVFGGSLGGPILKNRLFFFFNYEGRRDASESSIVAFVPSLQLRQGIVQYPRPDGSVAALSPTEIKNVIDPAGIGVSQAVLQYLQSYPAPNDQTVGDGLNTLGYRFKSPIKGNYNTYITRWDLLLGRNKLFFRGNYQDDSSNDIEEFPGTGPLYTYLNSSKGAAVGYDSSLSASMFNAFRYGYTRQAVDSAGGLNTSYVTINGISDRYATSSSLRRTVPVHTFRDDVSWIHGNHEVKFGGVVRLTDNMRQNNAHSFHYGTVNASWMQDSGSQLDAPLNDLDPNFRTSYRWAAAAVMGLVSQVDSDWNFTPQGQTLAVGDPVTRSFAQQQYEMYINDAWRIARGLTLNAGIRWTLAPPVYETSGAQVSPNIDLADWFNTRGALAAQGKSQADAGEITYYLRNDPKGRPLYDFHKKSFAPRLAVVYSPQTSEGFWGKLFGGPGRTSFRAGAGVYYDNLGQGVIRFFDQFSLGLSTTLTSPYGASVADVPRFTSWDQVPASGIQAPPPVQWPQVAPPVGDVTGAIDNSIKPPYSIALDFSIQRELPHDFFFEAAYVGRLSRRSLIQRDLAMPANLADPSTGVTYYDAMKQLIRLNKADTPIENVAPIPYWENMFPSLADLTGLTATQTAYYFTQLVAPSYTDMQIFIDQNGLSALGPYAMFNEQYSSLTAWSSIGGGDYHSGQFSLRKRFSGGVQFDLNYTLSKSIDLGSAAERAPVWTDLVINSWSPGQLKAVSAYDVRHAVNASWVVELPFGKEKKWGAGWKPAVDAVLGGWQVSGVWRMTSGLPTSVRNGGTWPTNWQIGGYGTQVGPSPEQGVFKDAPAPGPGGTSGPNIFADPAAAIKAWDFTDAGESGQRNGVRGDGHFTVDMGLSKAFRLPWEGHRLQFRWEVFNISNSVRFDPWSATTGLTSAASFGKYGYLLTKPRVMQFALRYDF